MVPFRVNCTIPTLSKSKAVRGKYCIVLPGEETFEKSSRPIHSLLHRRFYCRHATLLLSTDAAKKLKYSLCTFAEILHAKQSHQSGWNRVIGKILALTKDTLIPRRVMCLVGSFSIGYLSTGPVHRLVFAIHTGFWLNWLGLLKPWLETVSF